MKKVLLYTGFWGVLQGCASYRGPDQVSAIIPDNCYYYEHKIPWWQVVGREKVSPFTYRHIGSKGKNIKFELRSMYRGVMYTDTLQMSEKILRRFSVVVPCTAVDSLAVR